MTLLPFEDQLFLLLFLWAVTIVVSGWVVAWADWPVPQFPIAGRMAFMTAR